MKNLTLWTYESQQQNPKMRLKNWPKHETPKAPGPHLAGRRMWRRRREVQRETSWWTSDETACSVSSWWSLSSKESRGSSFLHLLHWGTDARTCHPASYICAGWVAECGVYFNVSLIPPPKSLPVSLSSPPRQFPVASQWPFPLWLNLVSFGCIGYEVLFFFFFFVCPYSSPLFFFFCHRVMFHLWRLWNAYLFVCLFWFGFVFF